MIFYIFIKDVNMEVVCLYLACKEARAMHNSDAISILNCAFDIPSAFV